MVKDSLITMKKSSPRWIASEYKANWRDVVALLTDKNFIIDIVNAIALPKGASILEIGIGSCKWSAAYSIMGYKVTAIDNNSEMLEQAKHNFPNVKIEYVLDELPNLKSAASKQKYALVFSDGLIEHFTDRKERVAAIRAMGNCCVDGGHAYVIVPFLSEEEDEHRYTSINELRQEIIEADLVPVDIVPITLVMLEKRKRMFLRVLAKRDQQKIIG